MKEMSEEEITALFDGFDASRYEEEVKARWGNTDAYKEPGRRTSKFTEAACPKLNLSRHVIPAGQVSPFPQGTLKGSLVASRSRSENHARRGAGASGSRARGRFETDCPPALIHTGDLMSRRVRSPSTRLLALLAFALSCGGRAGRVEEQRTDGGPSATSDGGAGGTTGIGAAGLGSGGTSGGAGRSGSASGGGGSPASGETSGGSGAAGAGGSTPAGVCASDSDCRVAMDCCVCAALGPGEESEGCGDICGATECSRQGLDEARARCAAGRCVLDRRCDGACAGAPSCAAGEQPALDEAEACGQQCLPVTECSNVSSCAVCEEAGAACVVYSTAGRGSQTYHCVSVPEGCDGSCECMRVCSEETECQPPSGPRALTCYRDCPQC